MTYFRHLASGSIIEVDDQGHTTRPEPHPDLTDGCGWLIEVPSNNPEPDFPSDCWKVVECGAPVFTIPGNPDGWRCAEGHEHRGIQREWMIDGQIEAAARSMGRDLASNEEAQIREAFA